MNSEFPEIISRTSTIISPWVELIAREVSFSPVRRELYHSLRTADYVTILAVSLDGRIPLVRQYRPALEAFTLELPAGLRDPGEEPAVSAARELLEETGFPALAVHSLGTTAIDSSRSSSHAHSFFVRAGEQQSDFKPEEGVIPQLVTKAEFLQLIRTGDLGVLIQLGVVMQAIVQGHFSAAD
jgi:ADP-ribose pyrophosphatase